MGRDNNDLRDVVPINAYQDKSEAEANLKYLQKTYKNTEYTLTDVEYHKK